MDELLDLPLEVDEFVTYQKDLTGKKSKNQKKVIKITKMKNDLIDPQKKKQRHAIRRAQQKNKLQKQLNGLSQQEVRKFLDQKKQNKLKVKQNILKALYNGQMIFVDLVYEEKMNQKQNKSLAIQIELIMKAIKHLQNPPGIHLCSVAGKAQIQLQKMNYHFWTLVSHKEDVCQVAKQYKKKVIYLSPDADKPLTEVNQDTAYVIGGLVDRTVIKNASRNRANDLNIQSRYLPIRQMMKNRSCLNLDHVVMILCKFKECQDWKIAFEFGAPKRWKKDIQKLQNKEQQQKQQKQEQQQTLQIQRQQQINKKFQEQKEQKML